MNIELPEAEGIEFEDRVVHIGRVAKVVKGGRRFRFNALVVVGNKAGIVGYGLGKASEVPDAIRKAVEKAKKQLIKVPIVDTTIPFTVMGKFDASRVFLKPASKGSGVIAGSVVRAVVELAGIKDILTKCLGSRNPHNVVKATIDAFLKLQDPKEYMRRRKG